MLGLELFFMDHVLAALTLIFTGALLVAERRGSSALRWATKPLASASFIGTAVAAGALATTFGQMVLLALVLSLVGDVLLIFSADTSSPAARARGKRSFLFGLVSFLLGHLAYAGAFVLRGLSWGSLAIAAVVVSACSSLAARWLLPFVEPKMKGAVVAYVVVISTMVATAAATVAARGAPVLLLAALAFYLSDLAVARNRFVAPGFVNRAVGLPLYYGAQVLFALSVGG